MTLTRRLVISHLAFVAATLAVGIAVVGGSAWREATRAGVRADRAAAVRLAPLLAELRRQRGSWEEVLRLLQPEAALRMMEPHGADGQPMRPGVGRRMPPIAPRRRPPAAAEIAPILAQPIVVADATGELILARNLAPEQRAEVARLLHLAARTDSATGRNARVPQENSVLAIRGVPIPPLADGPERYLFVGSMISPRFNPVRARFLGALAVVLVGLLAVLVPASILVAVRWSRALSRPLVDLATASDRLASGERAVRVPVRRPDDEIAVLARAFNAMGEAIEAQESARRRFVADAAHELRTPLAMLGARIELLASGVYQPDSLQWEALGGTLGRLSRLVDDLQTLARLDAGRMTLAREPIALAEVVAIAVGEMDPAARAAQVRIATEDQSEGARVAGDRGRLTQLLSNLLSNAIRHAPAESEVRVTIGAPQDGAISLAVEDAGHGIPPRERERVFERFVRLEPGRERASGGSGLGLAIARELALAHGGSLSASDSSLGGGPGARLVLTLPIASV